MEDLGASLADGDAYSVEPDDADALEAHWRDAAPSTAAVEGDAQGAGGRRRPHAQGLRLPQAGPPVEPRDHPGLRPDHRTEPRQGRRRVRRSRRRRPVRRGGRPAAASRGPPEVPPRAARTGAARHEHLRAQPRSHPAPSHPRGRGPPVPRRPPEPARPPRGCQPQPHRPRHRPLPGGDRSAAHEILQQRFDATGAQGPHPPGRGPARPAAARDRRRPVTLPSRGGLPPPVDRGRPAGPRPLPLDDGGRRRGPCRPRRLDAVARGAPAPSARSCRTHR